MTKQGSFICAFRSHWHCTCSASPFQTPCTPLAPSATLYTPFNPYAVICFLLRAPHTTLQYTSAAVIFLRGGSVSLIGPSAAPLSFASHGEKMYFHITEKMYSHVTERKVRNVAVRRLSSQVNDGALDPLCVWVCMVWLQGSDRGGCFDLPSDL